jgi:hypothetical protein
MLVWDGFSALFPSFKSFGDRLALLLLQIYPEPVQWGLLRLYNSD